MPDALGAVDQVVDLPLEDRLEVGLHLAARHLHPDGQRQAAAGLDVVDVRADDLDLAVVDLVHVHAGHELEGRGPVAAELDVGVRLADALALEGRAVGHGDRHLGDLDLAAAHLQGLLHHRLVGHVGDDVLVGADAGGQDLRDVGVGDDGEAVVDRPGRGGVLLGVTSPRASTKAKMRFLLYRRLAVEVAGLDAAEGEGRAVGEAQGVDQGGDVPAEGHQAGLPAELHAFLGQLLGELLAVGAARP